MLRPNAPPPHALPRASAGALHRFVRLVLPHPSLVLGEDVLRRRADLGAKPACPLYCGCWSKADERNAHVCNHEARLECRLLKVKTVEHKLNCPHWGSASPLSDGLPTSDNF